jgi:hypothetical protein
MYHAPQVFVFVVNDKGSSWAYATPGYGAPLAPGLLRQLRDAAGVGGVGGVSGQSKCQTEVGVTGARAGTLAHGLAADLPQHMRACQTAQFAEAVDRLPSQSCIVPHQFQQQPAAPCLTGITFCGIQLKHCSSNFSMLF